MAIRTTPFLLGGSRALQNWIAQDKRNTQVNQYNTQQQKEFDANLAKSYNTNRIKTPIGQAYQQEILSDVQKLNDVGAKYLAQGFDVYNPNFRDPKQVAAHNQYLQDKAMVESKIAARSDYEKTVDAERKEYQKNPYGFDNTPDDVYSQFEKSNTLNDIVNKGIQYPSLQRTFDYNKNVAGQIPVIKPNVAETLEGNEKIIKETANIPVITAAAERVLNVGPNRNWVEKEIGGSIDGLLKTIDENAIRKALDSEFRSPTSLDMMAELKNKGKVPAFGTPQYDKFLDDATNEQLKAEKRYDKILSDAVQIGMEKSDPTYKRVADFSLATEQRAREAAARARRGEQREITRFNERNDTKGGETVETPTTKTFYTNELRRDGGYPTKEDREDKNFKAYRRKAITLNDFIPLNDIGIALPSIDKAYNISQGRDNVKISGIDAKITGIGYAPVTGGGKQLTITVKDNYNGEEFAISEKNIPTKIKNRDEYQSAIKAIKNNNSVTPPKSAPKSNKKSDPLGLGI